jgi:hypothetical protein
MKFISTEGYKRNSPDKNRPFNVIPSGNITMQDVDFPVKGVDNLGNEMIMMPGEEYTFPGDYVVETPMAQLGGNTFDFVRNQNNQGLFEDYNFNKFRETLPDNLKNTNPSTYNMKGYWEALGKPANFDYSQPTEEDGYYHAFSRNPKTGEILKSPNHPTFKTAIERDIQSGYTPYVSPEGKVFTFGKEDKVPEGYRKYQAGGTRRPIFTSNPNDPRIQNYGDSLNLYNYSKNLSRSFPNLPEVTEQQYKQLQEKDNNLLNYEFDQVAYKKDKNEGKVKNFDDYIYSGKKSEIHNTPQYLKNNQIELDKYSSDETGKYNIELPDGTIKSPGYLYNGKPQWDDYSIWNPNTKTSSHYTKNFSTGKYELSHVLSDNIKPIKTKYFGEDKTFKGDVISTSSKSTGWYKKGEKPVFKTDSKKEYVDTHIPLETLDVYKKPVQPVIYKKQKLANNATPTETLVVTKAELTPTPKVERKVVSVAPEEVKAGTKTTSGKQIGSGTAGGRIYRVKYDNGETEILNEFEYRSRGLKMQEGGQTGWLDNYQDGGPQMYPGPSLQFQQQVQNFVNKTPNTFVRREPITVSQSDNTRTNAVENAKRDLESYTPQERAYFAQNNIPRDQWFSAKTKMQNDAVLKRREEVRKQAQVDVENNFFKSTKATNEQLRNEFRLFPNDPNSFFDEYLNVPNHIGNFAASLGENFTGEQPFDPWKLATDIVTPAFVGMTAGIGAQNTGQFVNNLINPLAGIGNPLKRSVNITSSVDNVIQPATPKPWQMQELPGLHLKSTMEGEAISKIIEPKTGLINTEQALAIIGKESGGADKVALIRQGLGDNIPQKMDYNDFRKTVQDQLIPLEKQFSTRKSDYGIDRLGYNYGTVEENIGGTFNVYGNPTKFKTRKEAEEFLKLNSPIENQTLILGNKNKFGRGSDAHGNPEETLGHAHFLRDAETPDVLTVTQIQSDAFQGTHRIMPKDSKNLTALEKQQNSLARMEELQERNKSILNKMKTEGVDEAGLPVQDYQIRQFEDIVKAQENANIFKKADIENFTQKQLLDKNHQERYLQELVDYAGKRGDVNKMRVPTSETAAKVQGYNPIQESTLGPITKKQLDESSTFEEFFTLKDEEIKKEIGDYELNSEEINTIKKIYNDYKAGKLGKVYDPAHTTILKKYEEQPKTIKKLFGKEPTIVTDSKGNTWYEFDIPEKFKKGKGEIKAFSMLPAIPAAGAVAGSVNNEKRDGGEIGWLEQYQEGGPQMYPRPSLEFQQKVQNFIKNEPNKFYRRSPVQVSQSDNTRTNYVNEAKKQIESYSEDEIKYFLDNKIPKDKWGIEKVKLQQQNELRARESAKKQSIEDVKNNPFAITRATNENLRNEFRLFPNQTDSFFDEYLNPAQMIGNLAASIGDNFTGEGPIDPWKLATDIVTPAFVGMTAGIGAQNTGQFANNLINPLAGMRNPLSRVSSKIEPIDNVLDKGVLEEIRYAFHNNQRRLSADERKILYQYGTGQPSDYFDENLQSLSSQFMQERASPRYKPHLLADDWHKMANGLRPINYPHLTRESNEVKQHLLNSRRNQLPPPPSEIQFMPDGTTRDIYTQQPQPVMPTMLGGIDIRRPINGHAPGTDEWNRLNNLLHSRARNNYKPKSVNKSGLTKEETLQKVTGKDKDAISKMSETEFENTVLKPDGQLAEYRADPFVEQMTFDRSTGRNVLKDQTVLTEQEYVDAFNSNLDLLNDIIKRRNKSGVEYRVKGLNPNGSLTFYTPEQTIANANNPVPKHYLDALNKIDEPDFLYKKTSDDKFYFSNMSGSPGFTSKEEAKKWISDLIDKRKGVKINSGESNWGVRLNPGKWKGNVEDLANTEYLRSIPGIEMSNTTAGVFSDRVARKGTGAYESINEYLKALDLGRVKPGFNSQTDYSRGAWENFIKSGRGVGFYANPRTVYGSMKTLAPIGVGIGAGAALKTKEKGGQTGWLDKYK